MGFRFRKSIKAGPIRINLSKSGVGYSVGGKGFRVTRTAKGTVRTTASIPGTGISHVTETSARNMQSGRKRRVWPWILGGAAILFLLFSILTY